MFDRRSNRLLGYLVDLTVEGAMVIGDCELQPGISLPVRLDMPAEICPSNHLDVEANVVWCRPDEDGSYKSGVQLLNVDSDGTEMLNCFILNFGLPE